jgi:hypothetical protein
MNSAKAKDRGYYQLKVPKVTGVESASVLISKAWRVD